MELDQLDRLAAEAFPGSVVRKDLALKFKGQYPVPTYVGEFLLGRYAASTDENEIAEGLVIVQQQLQNRTVEHLKRVPFGPDGEKNIEALAQAYVDFALANRRMWNLLLAHNLPPGSTMPQAFFDNINKMAAIVRGAVAPLAANTSREKLDATAWAFWTGIHGITAVAAAEKGLYVTPATAQSYAKDLVENFIKGLR